MIYLMFVILVAVNYGPNEMPFTGALAFAALCCGTTAVVINFTPLSRLRRGLSIVLPVLLHYLLVVA